MAMSVLVVMAPISGQAVDMGDVPDPVFATGMIGPGIAIEPDCGEVRAPLNGSVSGLFPSHHALVLRSENGVEVLIHVGIETAKMGELFSACVNEGDEVQVGEILLRFDLPALRAKAVSALCPVIISLLPDGYRAITLPVQRAVRAGVDPVLELHREEGEPWSN